MDIGITFFQNRKLLITEFIGRSVIKKNNAWHPTAILLILIWQQYINNPLSGNILFKSVFYLIGVR